MYFCQSLTDLACKYNPLLYCKKVSFPAVPYSLVVLPIIATKINPKYAFYDYGITIVECGSKELMPFFIRVLNAFRIPYVAIYDSDTTENAQSKIIEAEVSASGGIGRTEIIDPNFEKMCANEGVMIPTGSGKPFKAFKCFKELDATKIPKRLKEIIEKIFTE